MKFIFGAVGTLSILLGLAILLRLALTARSMSGGQIQMIATVVLGGLTLIGIARVLGRLDRAIKLGALQSRARQEEPPLLPESEEKERPAENMREHEEAVLTSSLAIVCTLPGNREGFDGPREPP
jgi:hypothetical protein